MERFKYLSALEISPDEVCFAVSRFSYVTNAFLVVHKGRIKGHWIDGGKIIKKDEIVNFLNESIATFEANFRSKIEKISLVIPDNTSSSSGTDERMALPYAKQITKNDLAMMSKSVKQRLTNDRDLVIRVQYTNFSVDGRQTNFTKGNIIGQFIDAKMYVTTANQFSIADHIEIVKSCGKNVNNIKTTSMAHSELLIEDDTAANVIINWGNKKTTLSFFTNGVLVSVKELELGIDKIVNSLSNQLSGINKEIVCRYIFKILNLGLATDSSDIILRKLSGGVRVECTASELKIIVANNLRFVIDKIDQIIARAVGSRSNLHIYHVGKITNFTGYDAVLKSYSKYSQQLLFSGFDLVGGSENWTHVVIGLLWWEAKNSAAKYQIKKAEEEAKKVNAAHQLSVEQQQKNNSGMPMHGNMVPQQMMQKGYIK